MIPPAGSDPKLWPEDFVRGKAVAPPARWNKPGVALFFNLECPGCVARGVPLLKRLAADYGEKLEALMIHTSYGHTHYAREDVAPTLEHFAAHFARISFPIALDLDGSVARSWEIEGTPHWLVFAAGGALLRSIYGSQENALTRLEYLLAERVGG